MDSIENIQEILDQVSSENERDFERLQVKYEVSVIAEVDGLGESYINELLQKLQIYRSETLDIITHVADRNRKFQKLKKSFQSYLDLEKARLLNEDDEIKSKRAFAERESMVKLTMRGEYEILSKIEEISDELQELQKLAQAKKSWVNDTHRVINTQWELIREYRKINKPVGKLQPQGSQESSVLPAFKQESKTEETGEEDYPF